MAMLAEPRRKQKWSLNPRGRQWSEDSNKFGQKMLEKMGWTSGKGLGANEQGMTEHVKVSHKHDQAGIGFKDKGDQWTQHQVDFNDFLSQLQGSNEGSEKVAKLAEKETELSGQSLELKSRQSRARVHYHKFTRGKDVNKYSSKDLANIFGKRDLKEKVGTEKLQDEIKEISSEPVGSKDNTAGVITIKGGNINDYFKNKMPNFMMKGNADVKIERADSDSETERRVGFGFNSVNVKDENDDHSRPGFGFSDKQKTPQKDRLGKPNFVFENAGLDLGCLENVRAPTKPQTKFAFENPGLDLDYPEKPKTQNGDNCNFVFDNPGLNLNDSKDGKSEFAEPCSNEGFVNPALNLHSPEEDGNQGAEFEVSRVQFGLDNNALDLTDENSKKKRVTFNDKVEYNTDLVKKKKGKAKLDKFEVENDKIRKKLRGSITETESVTPEVIGFVNEALDVELVSEEINDNEVNERKSKKTKRKKERRLINLETIEEALDESKELNDSEIIGEAVILEESVPKKNKKSKAATDNAMSVETNQDDGDVKPETPKKRKKDKKRHKSKGEEEIDLSEVEKIQLDEINNVIEATVVELNESGEKAKKKKDKKRRKTKDREATDQLAAETIQPDVTNNKIQPKEDKVNETIEGDKKKSKKRKANDLDNIDTPSKKTKSENQPNEVEGGDVENLEPETQSPWNKTGRRSKKLFKSLFVKAPTLYFSGSNINEIKGYGVDIK